MINTTSGTGHLYNNMQYLTMIRQISMIAIAAIAIGEFLLPADSHGSSNASFGNTRYPYYYGPEGRLVLVDSALEAVNKGPTTIGIKTPVFALISSHIKPTRLCLDL